jgi:metal-responsive CopG/Arc/MetJ family transcriptional regulator
MDTTIAKLLPLDELEEFDRLRRDQGFSRMDAIREAVRWYIKSADILPFAEDFAAAEVE